MVSILEKILRVKERLDRDIYYAKKKYIEFSREKQMYSIPETVKKEFYRKTLKHKRRTGLIY